MYFVYACRTGLRQSFSNLRTKLIIFFHICRLFPEVSFKASIKSPKKAQMCYSDITKKAMPQALCECMRHRRELCFAGGGVWLE